MGDGSRYTDTSVDEVLEKHWSALPIIDRAVLLKDLGIDGKNEKFLGGMDIAKVLELGQDDLPGEIRGRLIMAATDEGFSKEEYERVRDLMRGPKYGPERG